MAFENLTIKLQEAFKRIKGRGKLSEKDVTAVMREVKLALLEADVNFKVVKELIGKITERAVGSEVLESLTPGQQVVKIVHDELTNLMGTTQSKIDFNSKGITVIMLVGLQGSGKTTTCGKLASLIKKQGKKPLLVAADIYRPAAIKQLQVLGKQLDIEVFSMGDKQKPVDIVSGALRYAESNFYDTLLIDTAGRLHIDEELMEELKTLKEEVKPDEILLVVDSMTGQDAVNVSEAFNNMLAIDGVVLTKLDGDTRGGAALSVKAVTGKPIKFVGMGEKLSEIEPFYPERMASRILGMGDILSLIDKAEEMLNKKKAAELEKKLIQQKFTLDDFLEQFENIRNMGSLDQIMSMIPGANANMLKGAQVDDRHMARVEAIIKSMTKKEREDPYIINSSRKKRIALGSGTRVQDVNNLLNQFNQMQKMMKQFGNIKKAKKGRFRFPF